MIIDDNLKGRYQVTPLLRFATTELETAFHQAFAVKILTLNRIALILALLMYTAFFILDISLGLSDFALQALLRLAVVPATILFTLVRSFYPDYKSKHELFILLPLITAGLGHFLMVAINPLPPNYLVSATILMLLYNYLFSGLRLQVSVVTGVFFIILYEVGQLVFANASAKVLLFENFFLLSANILGLVANYLIERFIRADFVNLLERRQFIERIEEANLTKERLLQNILPSNIVTELYEQGEVKPRDHKEVTVMFIDIVNFTMMSHKVSANDLVKTLNRFFVEIDRILLTYGVEKLKTMGDSYLCASGLVRPSNLYAHQCRQAALSIIDWVKEQDTWFGYPLQIRIGIHSGPVTAGVVGESKFVFDIWGDTVNTASRFESTSLANQINISQTTYDHVGDDLEVIPRGSLPIKGQHAAPMYSLQSEKRTTEESILKFDQIAG
jgi:class 3 adenylate cyclase